MTIINAYGIGAGRAISDEIDNESVKSRKENRRRIDALSFVERERLNKRFKQLVSDTANPSEHLSAARPTHAASDALQSLKDRAPQSVQALDRLPSEEEQLVERTQASQDADRPLSARSPDLSSRTTVYPKPARTDRGTVEQDKVSRTRDEGQEHLLDSLIPDTQRSSVRLTRERVESALDRLSQALRTRAPGEVTHDEQDGVIGYLEFLEGFFEGSGELSKPPEQIAGLMADIRMQLNIVADPVRAISIQSAVITSQSEDATPIKGLVAEDRKDRIKSRTTNVADGEDLVSDFGSQAEAATEISNRAAGTSPSTQSSLSKDAQRRREETIVSVTLRSV